MEDKLEQFCSELKKLDPEGSDGLVADLYDLVELIDEKDDISSVFETVFKFFEDYPDADVGNPGPLVHMMERRYPNYMFALLNSVRNNPTYMSVFMLNRVLNSDLSSEKRENYLELLKAAAFGDSEDEIMKENAQELYQYQTERGS